VSCHSLKLEKTASLSSITAHGAVKSILAIGLATLGFDLKIIVEHIWIES
jgi:hypothetical protein